MNYIHPPNRGSTQLREGVIGVLSSLRGSLDGNLHITAEIATCLRESEEFTQPPRVVSMAANEVTKLSPPKVGLGYGTFLLGGGGSWRGAEALPGNIDVKVRGIVSWAMSGPTTLQKPTREKPGIRFRYAYLRAHKDHSETEKEHVEKTGGTLFSLLTLDENGQEEEWLNAKIFCVYQTNKRKSSTLAGAGRSYNNKALPKSSRSPASSPSPTVPTVPPHHALFSSPIINNMSTPVPITPPDIYDAHPPKNARLVHKLDRRFTPQPPTDTTKVLPLLKNITDRCLAALNKFHPDSVACSLIASSIRSWLSKIRLNRSMSFDDVRRERSAKNHKHILSDTAVSGYPVFPQNIGCETPEVIVSNVNSVISCLESEAVVVRQWIIAGWGVDCKQWWEEIDERVKAFEKD
ncbi:hypothetical protein TrVE_jg1773 [Triparma verrucosa]|uniref:Uncharacterized protein n=1 Tax=Triparma verrucosa TaxID=1606542 RepID=A0A9W7KUT6_9STRA|nr:hypothetical protein TrVE_jg1773 [Triparma verrucosa]